MQPLPTMPASILKTDGFLEHSPSRGSQYHKGHALQKIIPVWGYVYIYTHTYVCMCVCMCVYIYTYIYIPKYIYIYIPQKTNTHTHICIYIYSKTQSHLSSLYCQLIFTIAFLVSFVFSLLC